MRKVILIAAALVLCFTLSASAAGTFVLEPEAINTEANTGSVVIYTSAFGDTILSGEINDEHGFKDFYVLTIVPKITNENVSGESSSFDTESNLSDEELNSSVENATSSVDVSDIIPPIIPSESTDSVAETASALDYKYKIQAVYKPGSAEKNISIPQNGFVVVFPASKLGDIDGKSLTAGASVVAVGIDVENNRMDEGAYLEIDISDKGLLGDIPQTSDDGRIAFFAVLAVISGVAAIRFYNKKKSFA